MDPYYRSQKWNYKRASALARAKYQCEFIHPVYGRCKCRNNLNVHHLTYERFRDEVVDDLMVVCRHHHVWIHKQEKMTPGDASLSLFETPTVENSHVG